MADSSISGMTAVTTPATSDLLPTVQTGANFKMTIAQLFTLLIAQTQVWVAQTFAGITNTGAQVDNVTVVTAAGPTTFGATDRHLALNPTVSATQTVNLPAGPVKGRRCGVSDMKGIAGGNTITIQGNGANILATGGSAASVTITNNFGMYELMFNGTTWTVVSKY